jgi:hypothetical protein
VPAAIVEGQLFSIEAIGLASVSRFTGDQAGSNDIAMEAVAGQDPLEDVAGAGGLVAGAGDPPL